MNLYICDHIGELKGVQLYLQNSFLLEKNGQLITEEQLGCTHDVHRRMVAMRVRSSRRRVKGGIFSSDAVHGSQRWRALASMYHCWCS